MKTEITCSACGRDALLVRAAKYEGFKRVGDSLTCSACGHEYESEEQIPFKEVAEAPSIFTDEDRSDDPLVFSENEGRRICRHCRNYVVNPFTQRCGIHMKAVEATDSCADFVEKEDEEDES